MTDESVGKGSPSTPAVKRQAALVLALVLLAGLLIGMAADRLWLTRHWGGRPPRGLAEGRGARRGPDGPSRMMAGGFPGPMTPERATQLRHGMVQRLTRELDLSATQQHAIDSIMAANEAEFAVLEKEMRPRMRAFLERSRAQIDSVLTPDQRARFHRFGPPGGAPEGPPGAPPPPPTEE